jgi:PfaB family protein
MRFEPIAIIGQSCVLPGALDPTELWDVVVQARDMVAPAPDDLWRIDKALILTTPNAKTQDRAWSDHGGYVRGFDERFDPSGFTLPAAEIQTLDPVFRWTLHGVREALRSARIAAPLTDEMPAIGLVLGNLSYPTVGLVEFAESVWFGAQAENVPRPPAIGAHDPHNRFSSGLPAHLAAQALNLRGDAFALDAACASSLYAIKLACDRLQDRRADVMVAGAVNRTDDLFIHIGFCALQAMSRRGESRPFAADADGLVPAEGAAFVVLKRLDDAVAAGDEILGVIRGVGLSNDGNAGGFLSPSAAGQQRAMEAAYAMAGLTPANISLLECHATGTAVGDATEIESAAQLFHGFSGTPIGSLKANLGHLITAAGAAGLIKVLGALRTGIRPPSLPVATPLAALASSPFRLLQAPEPWERIDGAPRRAAISAFGFGGNNAHLIVEEWTDQEQLSIDNCQLTIVNEVNTAPATQPLTIHNGAERLLHDQQSTINNSPIAIIGVEATVGPYTNFAAFTQALLDGRGGTTLETVDVDLGGLRFPPNDLKQTLPQQLLIMEVARRLAANHPNLPTERTSVFIGMGCDPEIARYSMRWRLDEWASQWAATGQPVSQAWIEAAKAALIPGLEAAGVIGTMPNIPANRINAQLNLLGPSHTVSAEELSGVRALECAADALRRGEIDAAFVGAVDLSVEPVHQAAAHLLDPAHPTQGDAAVVLLLKRAADARRDGDAILAELTINNQQLTIDNSLRLPSLSASFGHAHAAAGLLDVAVGALCLHERVRLSADADGLLQPAEPWLAAEPREVRVQVDALGGQSSTVILQTAGAGKNRLTQRRKGAKSALRGNEKPGFLEKSGFWRGAIHVFSGADAVDLLQALERNEESNAGPARLVIVVQGDATFASQRSIARTALTRISPRPSPLADASGSELPAPRPSPLAKGIYFSPAPMPGEVGFVFTPAAAAYQGMGRELLFALPDLGDQVVGKFPCLARTQDWLAIEPRPAASDPFQVLQGCALLSQLHATLTQDWLGIKPDAVLGVSSGETNSMFATGAWHDMDAMFAEIDASGMYTREIAGEYAAARRAWAERQPGPISWSGWRVLAPVAEVEAALQGEEFAYLTMINAPADCLVAGQADACRRVVEKIGLQRCVENANEIIAHHPAVKSWEAEWRTIHHRETRPVEGIRFYSNARGGAYTPDRESVANALTDQATGGVDFRRVVEAAWNDGVRIFVEHGPRNVCSGWIRNILGERVHLVVALDRPQNGVDQLLDAVAQLVAAGVDVDYQVLVSALAAPVTATGPVSAPRRVLSFPAHYPPVVLPAQSRSTERIAPMPAPVAAPEEMNAMHSGYQLMEPPPALPPVLAYAAPQTWNLGDSRFVPASASAPQVVAPVPQTRNLGDSGFIPAGVPAPPVVAPVPQTWNLEDSRFVPAGASAPQVVAPVPQTWNLGDSRFVSASTSAPPVVAPVPHTRNLGDSGCVPAGVPAPEPAAPVVAPVPQTWNLGDSKFVPARASTSQPPTPLPEPARNPMVEKLTFFHASVSAAHQHFLAQQERALALLATLHSAAGALPATPPAPVEVVRMPLPSTPPPPIPTAPTVQAAPAPPPPAPVMQPSPVVVAPPVVKPQTPKDADGAVLRPSHLFAGSASRPTRQYRNAYPGPALDRKQLEHLASGKISEILGPVFAQQDEFVRQVRMPMPPLLLADRVLGIDAVAGAVGQKGVIWTETDIGTDAWYLHNGRVPVGVLIEAGQADLLLVSYLGADFVNKGERVYRLLGCEVTFRAELPQVGDTLHYEIHLDGYAQHGPVRIFFFHYDCFVGDRLVFSVREGRPASSPTMSWRIRTA